MKDTKNVIDSWSKKYRVKIKRDGEEYIAAGKYGEIADDYGDGLLRCRFTAVPRHADMNKALANRDRLAAKAGLSLHQRNGYETVYLFNPANSVHSKLVIKLIQPKIKRTVHMTVEQKTALTKRLAAARAKKVQPASNSHSLPS